jgi:hypothetical protein
MWNFELLIASGFEGCGVFPVAAFVSPPHPAARAHRAMISATFLTATTLER